MMKKGVKILPFPTSWIVFFSPKFSNMQFIFSQSKIPNFPIVRLIVELRIESAGKVRSSTAEFTLLVIGLHDPLLTENFKLT